MSERVPKVIDRAGLLTAAVGITRIAGRVSAGSYLHIQHSKNIPEQMFGKYTKEQL